MESEAISLPKNEALFIYNWLAKEKELIFSSLSPNCSSSQGFSSTQLWKINSPGKELDPRARKAQMFVASMGDAKTKNRGYADEPGLQVWQAIDPLSWQSHILTLPVA